MYIRQLTISFFGGICSQHIALTPEVNLIRSRDLPELSAAISFLLCSLEATDLPSHWIQRQTRLSAQVELGGNSCTLLAVPVQGRLQLSVTDPTGADITETYQHAMRHSPEQDSIECFDGQDRTIPRRLSWYRYGAEPSVLSGRTQRLADTGTFRQYLTGYIRNFHPAPLHSKKDLLITMGSQGEFRVRYPGSSNPVCLSNTDHKLFLYACFLHIAEFWADIEQLRDLHREKKPLLIRNFLEYLDESVQVDQLFQRTRQLQRQVLILTSPSYLPRHADEQQKE